MSHHRVKTTYNTEGYCGSVDQKTLYAHHNLSCEYVMFFDEDGEFIMAVPDTMDNNLLHAINRLYTPFKDNSEFEKGVEVMNEEDMRKCGL